MQKYTNHVSLRSTPQSEPIPGSSQQQNNAGGFSWVVDDKKRLERFVILGSEGGTYYVTPRELTKQNAEAVIRCIQNDGVSVVRFVHDVSVNKRAPKNDPALFVLALAATIGDEHTKDEVEKVFNDVVRTGTHLFMINEYRKGLGGWGRTWRRYIQNWYAQKNADSVAYQVAKYQQRYGWSHADVLRKAHPDKKMFTPEHQAVFRWIRDLPMDKRVIVRRSQGDLKQTYCAAGKLPRILEGVDKARVATTGSEIVNLISNYGLTWEMIPTQFLNDVEVWASLLPKMPSVALVRNLAKMTSIGLIKPMSNEAKFVADRLVDVEYLGHNVHPLTMLLAGATYTQGRGVKGSLTWHPVREVADALDQAFYLAFENVRPTNKRLLLALDVSGSMFGSFIAGSFLDAATAAAAMAMITASIEKDYLTVSFSNLRANNSVRASYNRGTYDGIEPIDLSTKKRITDVMSIVRKYSRYFSGTDCALPMLYANKQKLNVDAFVIYTDSETWAGKIHPSQALDQYRRSINPDAKMVVVGMTSNGFSIADPNDAGMLDVVGFSTDTPSVISDFITNSMLTTVSQDDMGNDND